MPRPQGFLPTEDSMPAYTASDVLVCDHPDCETQQVIGNHPANYAGWTIVEITRHGSDGLTSSQTQEMLCYCAEHSDYLEDTLNIGEADEDE